MPYIVNDSNQALYWECPRCRQIFDLSRQPDIETEHPPHCIELEKEAANG